MQRNYTPQGKPQAPNAIDLHLHRVQLADLIGLEPALARHIADCVDLHNLVLSTKIGTGGHTTGELATLVRQVRAKLGTRKL